LTAGPLSTSFESRTAPDSPTVRTRPRVLVLLASHNGERWIGKQIQTILAQRDVEVRVVIRDDGSTDGTHARIAPYLLTDPVSLTCSQTASGSAAQNFFALIRETPSKDFDFVALADQDDEWYSDKLVRASRQLRSASCAGYSSATLATWASGRTAVLTQRARATRSDFLLGGIGQGCTFVLTGEFYSRARDFLIRHPEVTHGIHYHDWALYALARTWSLAWTFDPLPSVMYRQHGHNDTGARSSPAGFLKRLRLIRSRWFAAQLRATAKLCAAADPSNSMISGWQSLLNSPATFARRLRIAAFCLRGGRRTPADNATLILAALAGWL
jgi:rhamnosyltransferase